MRIHVLCKINQFVPIIGNTNWQLILEDKTGDLLVNVNPGICVYVRTYFLPY